VPASIPLVGKGSMSRPVTRYRKRCIGDESPLKDANDWWRYILLRETETYVVALMAGAWATGHILETNFADDFSRHITRVDGIGGRADGDGC
jgi:hypothetical protein